MAQTSTLTRSVVALVCAGAALLLAPAAQAVDPLALARATPADGARVPPTPTGGIPWQIAITGPPPEAEVLVTVSTSPNLDPDGVLPTDDRADFFFLAESPTTPGTYAGRSDPGPNAWSAVAATYYWQVTATWSDASGVFHSAGSEVRRLVVGAPSATRAPTAPGGSPSPARTTLAMSSLDATYYVRALIRRRTGRPPVALRYGCARLTSRSFRCRPRWRDSRNVYSGTATFTHGRTGSRIVATGTLSGRRRAGAARAPAPCAAAGARSGGVRPRRRALGARRSPPRPGVAEPSA